MRAGELTCLLGPSGCGKTTTLRMIGGFLQPDAGGSSSTAHDVSRLTPERRPTAMVFQNYALWPHMTVFKNVAFGLTLRKLPKREIRERVESVLELVGLTHHMDSYPARISGGEQQRVALARALVLEPKVLLLDEPLSNLDAKLRVRVREDIREIQQRIGITTVFVTHDQDEALSISDRIAVMSGGKVEQYADAQRALPGAGDDVRRELRRRDELLPRPRARRRRRASQTGRASRATTSRRAATASARSAFGPRTCWSRRTATARRPSSSGRCCAGTTRSSSSTSAGNEVRAFVPADLPSADAAPRPVRPRARLRGRRAAAVADCGSRVVAGWALAIAHRGDWRDAPENTLAAFAAAARAGADMIEIDIRCTADGRVVVAHDPTLERVWGDPRAIAESAFAEVRAASGGGVPELSEVLAAIEHAADGRLHDSKMSSSRRSLRSRRAGALDRVLFSGGNIAGHASIRERSPAARIALTWTDDGLPDDELLDELAVEFWNPSWELVDAEAVRAMHERGTAVSAWTVDDVQTMARLLDLGVDAVITNAVGDLVGLVSARVPAGESRC